MPARKPVKKTEKKDGAKTVEALTHKEDKRKNIPTAEFQPLMRERSRRRCRWRMSGATRTWTRSLYGAARI